MKYAVIVVVFFSSFATTLTAKNLIVHLGFNEERISDSDLKMLLQGGRPSANQFSGAVTLGLLQSLVSQNQTPILVSDAYLLENLVIQYTWFQKLKQAGAVETNNWLAAFGNARTAAGQYLFGNRNEPLEDVFKTLKLEADKFKAKDSVIYSAAAQSRNLQGVFGRMWHLYRYVDPQETDPTSVPRAYLLLPNEGLGTVADLASYGFDPTHFEKYSFATMFSFLSTNGSYQSPATSNRNYSFGVLKIVNSALTKAPENDPWRVYVSGHGSLKQTIVSLSLPVTWGFLSIMASKNMDFIYFLSFYSGGANKEDIRQFLSNNNPYFNVKDTQTKEVSDFLAKLNIPREGNILTNMTMAVSTVGDTLAPGVAGETPLSMIPASEVISYYNTHKGRLILDNMPLKPLVNIDKFFEGLNNYFKSFKTESLTADPQILKNIFKYIIPDADNPRDESSEFRKENAPQVRFPGYDQPFNIFEITGVALDEYRKVIEKLKVDISSREKAPLLSDMMPKIGIDAQPPKVQPIVGEFNEYKPQWSEADLNIPSDIDDFKHHGTKLYIAIAGESKIAVIDLKNNKVEKVIHVYGAPYAFVYHQEKLYVGNLSEPEIKVIDPNKDTSYYSSDHGKPIIPLLGNERPRLMAISGNKLYFAVGYMPKEIKILNLQTLQVEKTSFKIDAGTHGIEQLLLIGDKMYIANSSDNIHILDTKTDALIAPIAIGHPQTEIAVVEDKLYARYMRSREITVADKNSGKIIKKITIPRDHIPQVIAEFNKNLLVISKEDVPDSQHSWLHIVDNKTGKISYQLSLERLVDRGVVVGNKFIFQTSEGKGRGDVLFIDLLPN